MLGLHLCDNEIKASFAPCVRRQLVNSFISIIRHCDLKKFIGDEQNIIHVLLNYINRFREKRNYVDIVTVDAEKMGEISFMFEKDTYGVSVKYPAECESAPGFNAHEVRTKRCSKLKAVSIFIQKDIYRKSLVKFFIVCFQCSLEMPLIAQGQRKVLCSGCMVTA